MHCIICGNEISDCRCARCGFDLSLSRECFPTLNSDGETLQALWVKRNEIYLNQQSAGAAGMKTDSLRIYKWYSSAAQLGDVPAMLRLADLKEQGTLKGTPKEISKLRAEAQGESASRAISRQKIEKLLFDSSKGFESRNQY